MVTVSITNAAFAILCLFVVGMVCGIATEKWIYSSAIDQAIYSIYRK
jgi:hypothetical protein